MPAVVAHMRRRTSASCIEANKHKYAQPPVRPVSITVSVSLPQRQLLNVHTIDSIIGCR